MIPRTFPSNASGQMLVADITPAGDEKEWIDFIPVQEVTEVAAGANRYDNNGHIPVDTLASVSGLTAWIDYIPVNIVEGRSGRWRTDADGFIPIVDKTA